MGGTGVSPVSYTWDCENRLIRVAPNKDPNELTGDDRKLELVYDYMGRRVEKKVYAWDPNAAEWESDPETLRCFVYYNWLPLLELEVEDPGDPNDTPTVLRKYAWGLDLSGSLEGAGGIGGLLATKDVPADRKYVYFYDANGNVGQLVDRVAGTVEARYEYDAYGNNLLDPNDPNESGPYADDNPFRFSTKYFDDETGLGYWGRRCYDPRLGRWTSRDRIGESGGENLYSYAANSSVNSIDALGEYPLGGFPVENPQPPPTGWSLRTRTGCCGPEISRALAAALHEVTADFLNAPEARRKGICDSLFDFKQAAGAWDINQLVRAGGARGGDVWNMSGCATGTCEGTVQVWGKCYMAAEVNYILFGRVISLCESSLTKGKWATWLHRTFFADPSTAGKSGPGSTACRQRWLKVGFTGGHNVSNMGDVAECEIAGCGNECCKKPWTGTFTGQIGVNRVKIGD